MAACVDLEKNFAAFLAGFDLTTVVSTGRLGAAFCVGQSGQISLGKIDITTALTSTASIDVPAQYAPIDGGAARALVCSLPRDSFTALASSAINKQAAIPFDKISLSCKLTNGAVFVQYANQKLTISLDVLTKPDPTMSVGEPQTTLPATTTTNCDDLSALLASPLKLLFGATICVPTLGRFLLHKVDLAQLSAVQQGKAVVFEGEFIGSGATTTTTTSASIALQCTVGNELVRLLLPLAQTLDVSKVDATAFANALDINCVDKAGAHKIVVNKSSVTGIDAALLAKVFKVANVDVNTYGQVYQLLAGSALAIGPFKLENGKLVTPYGTFDAGQAIDFLKDVAVVKTADGKLLSLSTPYGTVTLSASGELVFTGADGKPIVLSTGCIDVHATGAAIVATCKQQKVSFTPGGLVSTDNKLTTPMGEGRIALGAFKVPAVCAADQACLARVLATARDYLAKRNCMVAQVDADFQISCSDVKSKEDAQLLLDDVLVAVNVENELPRDNQAVAASLPMTKVASVAAEKLSIVIGVVVVFVATLL